jgi:very-short-patch-repair endonuclease
MAMANERARQLRTNQTDAERKLWKHLKALKSHGWHFRRQVPIDHFIVDFACYSARIVIELDGGQHNFVAHERADQARDGHLAKQGFEVLRFWNNDVLQNTEGVMERIVERLALRTPTPNPSPQGEGLRAASAEPDRPYNISGAFS